MTTSTSKILRPVGRRLQSFVEGDSVKETLEVLRGNHTRLEVQGSGRIDAVRIDGVRQDGVHLLVALQGSVTAETFAVTVIARAPDGTLRAGLLDDARAVDGELSVELLELDQPAKAVAPAKPTWAEVAKASAAQEPEPEEPSAPAPKLGDRINHPTFGECSIAKVETDDDFIIARTPTNRMLRLSLDVLRLELVSTDENGRTTFRARGGVRK